MKKMMDDSKEGKDSLTRIFDFTIYILDYIYQEISSIPKDFLTEIHLRFFRHNKNPNKKILGIWDFNQILSRMGDFMSFLEMLSVLRLEFNLPITKRNIDICFIEDSSHYNRKQLRYSKTYQFKKTVKSLVITSPFVDSVFIFRSNKEFERFYQQNRRRYIRWPPVVSGTRFRDYRIVERFYKKKGYIPKLTLPIEILSNIYNFYKSRVYPSLPIVLNIRKNSRCTDKNSNVIELRKFLKKYENNKSYKFIVVCNKTEIPEEFRGLKNVLFSKDYFDSVEYDLAFIETSYLGIFPNSGMPCFALFSKVPFIEYNLKGGYHDKYDFPKRRLNFMLGYQKIYDRVETSEWLVLVFEALVRYLKENNINNNLRNKVEDKKEYEAQF